MTLYHYSSGQGLFGIMNSDELHCSNVNFLNDSSEKSYFSELLDSICKNDEKCKIICEALYSDSFIRSYIDPTDSFIASFSKNGDSLSMWNYYARGNGYNIGVDIDKVIEENEDNNINIYKMELIYDQRKQIDITHTFILRHEENAKKYHEIEKILETSNEEEEYHRLGAEQTWLVEDFCEGIYDLMIQFKHQAYEREEEVRLIITEKQGVNNLTRFKISDNGVFIDYFPIKLKLRKNLKQVTIHPLNGKLHLEGTQRFIASKMGHPNTDIKISKIPFRLV